MSLSTPADRPSELFTWKIENFSKLRTKKLYSKIFYVGGYKWRVLVFPKGNNSDHLSVYLDVPDSATLPYGWSRCASFSITLINHLLLESSVKKNTQHLFNGRESDWGFTSFLPLKEVHEFMSGFLHSDTITLEVDVTILDSQDSENETAESGSRKEESLVLSPDNGSGNIEADTEVTSRPQDPVQSTLGSQRHFVDDSSEATAPVGKVRFLSYWVSSEASLLLERIHGVHRGTFVKFSMKGPTLQTVLLESFASFIESMSSTKVNDVNEETLGRVAISIEDFEEVGLNLGWLKQRLEEAKRVKKHSESVSTVESCESALEVARAKVCELEEGLAKAKAEAEVMSRELPNSLGVNDCVVKDVL